MTNNAIAEAELRGRISYSRQLDWFDPGKSDAYVTLVGCGGIGSPTALALAKLGIPNLRLIDPDTVDVHNIPNQMFPLDTVGQFKVDALRAELERFALPNVATYPARVLEDGFEPVGDIPSPPRFSGIIVSALDSMSARAALWKHLRYNISVPLLIDARLGGEVVVIHTVDPRKPAECERYELSLFSDDQAVEAPCTRRSIIDVGFVVSSLITRLVRRHLAGEPVEHTMQWNHARLNAMVGS